MNSNEESNMPSLKIDKRCIKVSINFFNIIQEKEQILVALQSKNVPMAMTGKFLDQNGALDMYPDQKDQIDQKIQYIFFYNMFTIVH